MYIFLQFKKYLKDPIIRELLVIGGVSVKEQISVLNSGVDIIVGTPGRLEDLIQGGYLSLTHCRYYIIYFLYNTFIKYSNSYCIIFFFRFFILDEADGLLKQGYTELIDRLHRQIPKITSDGKRLQMIVCSATLHAFEVKKMAVNI